jgi:hypothetical protein
MVGRSRHIHRLLIAILLCLVFAGCAPPSQPPESHNSDPLTISLGPWDSFYKWRGDVTLSSLDAKPGQSWHADFDIKLDLRELKSHPGIVQGLYVVLVGEKVYDREGRLSGMTALSISNRFTSAGIPISYYEGMLPVRALGNRRGSPFEAIVEFPAEDWANGGYAHLTGRLEAELPPDLEPGFYRPHVDIFVKFKGAGTPVDIGHLPYQLGQWLDANIDVAGPPGSKMSALRRWIPMPIEFMQAPQVLPEVRVGEPATPHIPWTIFHGVDAYGLSGILPDEAKGEVGLLSRVRLPTPLTLRPGVYSVSPGLPNLFPEAALADLFIGNETVPYMIKNYLDLFQGYAECVLILPNGRREDLGRREFTGHDRMGPRLGGAGFELDLTKTGDYQVEMRGMMVDKFGREYTAGGTYSFTVAMPLSFSTPVKPGTNYLVGGAFPASAHINPPVPAEVSVAIHYFPNSDTDREIHRVYGGQANRFGHFIPEKPPMRFQEPGEYRSLLTARYVDERGTLWQGVQSSAGVIAPVEPELVLHGGKTFLSPPDPTKPDYGAFERYRSEFEGGSSYVQDELLCQFDFIFPYHSGDTLHIATTYPFESVVGIVHSMEAKSRELADRLVQALNPDGTTFNFPLTPRRRKPVYLPDVFKFAEDNFAYYRISKEHPDQFPVLSANSDGLSPFQYPEGNELEAYGYVSVIRPGFPVMTLAYTGIFIGSCWIVSPNPYGGQINASPNGDLPGDLYRVMSGLVVKDRKTGKNYYDAYSASIVTLAPGSYSNSVTAPGTRPIVHSNGRDLDYFIGMDTSESYLVGDRMMLGGTVMPSVEANVEFTVTKPDGTQEKLAGRTNRLGGFAPPRPIPIDQPGVYKVRGAVERDGKTGDIVGTGDGEFYHFAVPPNSEKFLQIELPVVSSVEPGGVEIPISWSGELTGAKITYSIMMPGSVLDEGVREVEGDRYTFKLRPEQLAIQYPFIDTVDHRNGEAILADTLVMVFFLEAEKDGEKIYDVARLILRGSRLFNGRAMSQGGGHPGKPQY